MLQNILKNIGLSETTSRVYMRLLELGTTSARQLAENLNIPRPSIYDNLKILIKLELVVEQEQENKKLFQVSDTKNISHLLKNKIDNLKDQERELKNIIPTISKQSGYLEPKIKFHSGIEGIRSALSDMLWYEGIETLAIWPISEMLQILSSEYLDNFNRKRISSSVIL